MNYFTSNLTDMEQWPVYCLRDRSEPIVDGYGCSGESYLNLTQKVDIAQFQNKSQEEIDEVVQDIAGTIVADVEIRQTLEKTFSEQNPYSRFGMAQLRVNIGRIKTMVEKSYFGFYEEVPVGRYSDNAMHKRRMQWGQLVMQESVRFSEQSELLDVVAFTWSYQQEETMRLVYEDFLYVGLVIVACLLYMTFHMQSLFLASVSLFNVVMSLPVTLVIYRYVFGVTYFSSIHISIIIVIVGVGADDVFVFHDFWEGSFLIKAIRDDPKQRLTFTLRRASKSMFITSLTSTVAFASCVGSKIMPI
jgi:predicted RND superfamily exporter protein